MTGEFRSVSPEELEGNFIRKIGKEWMLVTAEKPDGTVNTMTAGWGGIGEMWGRPAVFVFIRPQRYTKEFVDAVDHFSLTFFGQNQRKALSLLGSRSGRDGDKIQESGLTLVRGKVPYFEEAEIVLNCRKLYCQQLAPECFTDAKCDQDWYPEKDYHYMYVAEIEEALVR